MRITNFTQTPFISYDDQNMVYIDVADWDMCNPFRVRIEIDGETVYDKKFFVANFSVMLPCYEEKRTCTVKIVPFEDLPIQKRFPLYPPKRWQIPLMYSSHEDLGYCAYIDKLHHECYEYLKKAMELCGEHEDFKYLIEHVWWLEAFDCYASDGEKELLKKLMREKRIELNALHSGIHTPWENAEQLVRGMYFGCIDAEKKYGIRPKCAFFTDLSGASAGTVNAFAKMGIKYMAAFANPFRNCREDENFPPLFWWEDKTGETRVLFWYQRSYRPTWGYIWCDTERQYAEGEFVFDETKARKTERAITDRINKIPNCAYDILPISFYDDRELPTTMLLTVCREMNRRWKYPRFKMEIPQVFMSELEEKWGDCLPTLRGEIYDQWADFATISPSLMSKKRRAARLLYDAEMLSVLRGINEKKPYNEKAFREAVWKMCEFDEHCWATSSKHPQKMHRYNMKKVKIDTADTACADMHGMIRELCGLPDAKVSLTDTVPQKRESSLRVDKSTPIPDTAAHQILPDGTVITEVFRFDGVEVKNFDAVMPYKTSVEIRTDCFETRYYRVESDTESKKIKSIIDKETNAELIDRDARFDFGQFVYLYTESKTEPNGGLEAARNSDLRIFDGEVAYVAEQKGYEEQSGAEVTARFIFYKNEKNIDIDLSYRNAATLIGDFYDRYKKNFFFALPFKLSEPRFYTESQVGETDEKTDKIEINAADFTVTQNWVAAENEHGGIAVYSEDMPVFHIGDIKYNRFESKFSADKAHYYLYACSNRCNNLLYTAIEDCRAEYRLSVLPYVGRHGEIVPQWSNGKEHKPIIGKAAETERRFIECDADNIRLVSVKKAENHTDAVMMRFTETAGKESRADIKLFFVPDKVVYCSNDERDVRSADTTGNVIHVKAFPYSYTTLKIYGKFEL